jgi:hypothetical protein
MTKSAAELVCHFESLGINCEFGFVQRLAGAEPIGLLRFAGMPLDGLLLGLRSRFKDIAEPGNLQLLPEQDEHRIRATNIGLRYHTELYEGEVTRDELHRLECRKVRFLAAKLIDDLEHQRKIFVYLRREPLQGRELVALLGALSAYGPVKLLWVVEADAQHVPGTVELVSDRLMVGYLQCFAPDANVHHPHLASWIDMLQAAYRIWPMEAPGHPDVAAPDPDDDDAALDREIAFGLDGNAAAFQVSGWANPEPGFTWAVGKESTLVLPRNSNADLMMSLACWPFVHPNFLKAQRMTVLADGAEIGQFRLSGRTRLQCPIPAAQRSREPLLIIRFLSPDATRRSAHEPEHPDTRELSFAFKRISLHRLGAR